MDDEQDNEEEPAGSPFDPCEDDEDESTLLSSQPGFNKPLLVLRGERVMGFVKYVSLRRQGLDGIYVENMKLEGSNDSESERSWK